MSTLKEIAVHLKSVKNIQKITKSMKMVSASKFAKAERDLTHARPFGIGSQAFYQKIEVEQAGGDDSNKNHLVIAVTSDRGLCGAANSSIAKGIMSYMKEENTNLEKTRLVAVGEKSRALLQRKFSNYILMNVADIGKKPPTFQDAATIATSISNNKEFFFDKATIYYNTFKSMISYRTTLQPLYSEKSLMKSKKINIYDSLDDDILRGYNEFILTSLIYHGLKEGAASEQSARMTAMDAASKNAGSVIDRLTLSYNRTRQAAITSELIEIISGAAAV